MHWITRFMVALVVLRMAAVPFSPDERALAQILEGEAGHQFMRYNSVGAYCVGWVARNRLESGRYGSSYAEIQAEFNGAIISDPRWRYLAIARLVINGKEDPTGGALYVLSQQDVDQLGFDVEKATLVIRASERRALFFFKEWDDQEHSQGAGRVTADFVADTRQRHADKLPRTLGGR